MKVLQKQLDAQMSSLSTSTHALDKQTAAADVQKAQLQDMLRKCHIMTPTKGTVLEKYVERGEFVSVGKPLFKMPTMVLGSARSMQAPSVGYRLVRSLHPRLSLLMTNVPTWCMLSRWLLKTTVS